eukprot:3927882-Alexandrium_andersonii.AAC.1
MRTGELGTGAYRPSTPPSRAHTQTCTSVRTSLRACASKPACVCVYVGVHASVYACLGLRLRLCSVPASASTSLSASAS